MTVSKNHKLKVSSYKKNLKKTPFIKNKVIGKKIKQVEIIRVRLQYPIKVQETKEDTERLIF